LTTFKIDIDLEVILEPCFYFWFW